MIRLPIASAFGFLALALGPADAGPQPSIDAATRARIPERGWLISYRAGPSDQDTVVVARIARSGPTELLRIEPGQDTSDRLVMWVDSKTLVLVDIDRDGNLELTWIVDGAIDAKRTMKHASKVWGQPADDRPHVGRLARTSDGAIWIESCHDARGGIGQCKPSSWVRIDRAVASLSKQEPRRLAGSAVAMKFRYELPRSAAPTVSAPNGYRAKLFKPKNDGGTKAAWPPPTTAFECTSPSGKTIVLPESLIRPAESLSFTKLRWIHATPPLLEVAGDFENQVGLPEQPNLVFRECSPMPLEDFAWINGHAWSYSEPDLTTVMVDDKPVATFVGSGLAAPP